MRKLTIYETELVRLIAATGGDYCPDPQEIGKDGRDLLHEVVKKGSLAAEDVDGITRYRLTKSGWIDAA